MIIDASQFLKPKMQRQVINVNDYDEDSRICCSCVSDHYLRERIQSEGDEKDCSFCDGFGPTFTLDKIAELVELAFNEHFERTSTEPSDWDYWRIKELDYDWDRDGEQVHYVIAEIAGIDEDVAEVITKILEDRHSDWDMAAMGQETEFDREAHYRLKANDGYNHHYSDWHAFEHRLQSECRFLGRASQSVLDEVFAGIDGFVSRDGKSIVRPIGPSTEVPVLYRARVFQNSGGLQEGLKRPDWEIGPPPSDKAAAGRMNAQGISVFYGALDSRTALAEVRPPVGSDVIVAKFEVLRPLRLLDIAALKEILVRESYFDPECKPLLERVAFLSHLSSKITRPAMPEREHTDYLVTQVIADYLASEHNLDGMIFPSVQTKTGVNVVLFHHACRTEELPIPNGTKIEVGPDGWSDDGPDPNYLVTESRPAPEKHEIEKVAEDNFDPLTAMTLELPDANPDHRQLTLRICIEDVEVRNIMSVAYTSFCSSARRQIKTQPEDDSVDP